MISIFDLAPPIADRRIPYADHPLQFGDLRLPPGTGPHPVVMWVHGGFWRKRFILEHAGHACAALTVDRPAGMKHRPAGIERGFATWNVEYRRIGDEGGWPNTFLDVAAAADALHDLAMRYPLDLGNAVVAGHSAGGHLALWLAGRGRIPASDRLGSSDPFRFHGAVSLAGVCDLRSAWRDRLSNGVVRELMGATPEEAPERYATANPAQLLPLAVPQILLHGTRDANVPIGISREYAHAAIEKGDPAEFVALEGAGHFELIDPRTREWAETERAIRRLTGTATTV